MVHQLLYANQNYETVADTIFDGIQNNLNQTKKTFEYSFADLRCQNCS